MFKKINNFRKNDKRTEKKFFCRCNVEITNAIIEEFLKRFFAPTFIILLGLSSSLIITSSKDQKSFKFHNSLKFIFGILLIIISEFSLTHSGMNISNFLFYFSIPVIFFLLIYSYLYFNLNVFRRN